MLPTTKEIRDYYRENGFDNTLEEYKMCKSTLMYIIGNK